MPLMKANWQKMSNLLKRVVVQEEIEVNRQFCLLKMFLQLKNGREIKPSAIGSEVKGTRETFR